MPDQSGSIEIMASPSTVFRLITEPEWLVRWVGGLHSTKRQGDGGLRKGTRSIDVVESFGHTVEVATEVTAIEHGRSLELALRCKAFDGGAAYLIEPLEKGVRLKVDGQVGFKGIYKLTGPMMAPAMQKKLQQDLERLKALAEEEETSSARA